jgi:hypothetical protein
VGITNEVPFSEFLLQDVPVADAPESEDAMLALTDQSANANVLGSGVLEDSDERTLTPEELAQGLEHVQAYEDELRQEVAAETVEAVMHPDDAPLEAHTDEHVSEAKPA